LATDYEEIVLSSKYKQSFFQSIESLNIEVPSMVLPDSEILSAPSLKHIVLNSKIYIPDSSQSIPLLTKIPFSCINEIVIEEEEHLKDILLNLLRGPQHRVNIKLNCESLCSDPLINQLEFFLAQSKDVDRLLSRHIKTSLPKEELIKFEESIKENSLESNISLSTNFVDQLQLQRVFSLENPPETSEADSESSSSEDPSFDMRMNESYYPCLFEYI